MIYPIRQCEILHNDYDVSTGCEAGDKVEITPQVQALFMAHGYEVSPGLRSCAGPLISGPATAVDFGHADPLEIHFCIRRYEVRIIWN